MLETKALKASSSKKTGRSKPKPLSAEDQASRISEIFSADPDRKALLLGLKDFKPLAKIADFSTENLVEFVKQHPLLAKSIIGAYDQKPKTN